MFSIKWVPVVLLLSSNAYSQTEIDSIIVAKQTVDTVQLKFSTKQLIIPAVLMTYGVVAIESDYLKLVNTQLRDELKESIDTDTTETVKQLNTKLTEAKTLVNLIGNVGVTGNYQNIADSHKKSANFWRVMAIVFMSIFSILLVWARDLRLLVFCPTCYSRAMAMSLCGTPC